MNFEILYLFSQYWNSIPHSFVQEILSENGGIAPLECFLMMLKILDTQPRQIIEFSPNHGYSTAAIATAQQIFGAKDQFATFEINPVYAAKTIARLKRFGLEPYCKVVIGDALVTIPQFLHENNWNDVEFCFVDSDHGAKFAQSYVDNIFPLLAKKCLIVVHDICAEQRSDDGLVEFKTSLQKGVFGSGEEEVIRKFITENNIKAQVIHSITGGRHEGAQLDVNRPFMDEIKKITQIDFGIYNVCPKTLWFKLP